MMFGLTDKLAAIVFGIASAILLALCAVLYIEANGFFWIDGLKDRLEKCERDRNELRAATSKKDEQKPITQRNIDEAEKGNREADRIADRIEKAPLPGNCETPPEIMGEDI